MINHSLICCLILFLHRLWVLVRISLVSLYKYVKSDVFSAVLPYEIRVCIHVNKVVFFITFFSFVLWAIFCEQLSCIQFLLAAALSVYSTKNLNTLVFLQI